MVLLRCCSSSYFSIHLGNSRKLKAKLHRRLGNSGHLQYTVRHANKRKQVFVFPKQFCMLQKYAFSKKLNLISRHSGEHNSIHFNNNVARTTVSLTKKKLAISF